MANVAELIISMLSIHLSVGQSYLLNSSQAIMLLEKISIESLAEKLSIVNGISSNLIPNYSESTVLIRVNRMFQF